MAEENPITAPEAADQPEQTSAETKPAENQSEKTAAPKNTSTENADATDDKKEPEAQTDKTDATGESSHPNEEGESASADAEPTAAESNGAPASAKKSSKDRRRSSGVGEKKLNRKKSQSRITHLDAKPGEYYLARLRSYAPWPSIICDEEILPNSLLESRPVTAIQKDGTYRAEYADDGKRAHERTFPVMFFETNEFAWIPNTNLTPLDPAECKDVSEKNKAKSLIQAYKVAGEGHDLQYFKKLLSDHEAALEQEREEAEREEEEKEKAKAEKAAEKAAKKNKRKSKGPETDVEMEDGDDTKKSKAAKKRKKDETDAEAEKPAKTPKTGTKIKLSTPKAPAEDKKKTPASKTKKAAPKKGKAAAAAASDEEAAAATETKQPEKQVDPEELKKKKEKEILFLRHKLQKGFISRDQPPKEDEMATMATYFDKLEKHADLEVAIIRSTKINKVLKMIVKLNSIPRDEEFNFRSRSMSILSSWKNVLDGDAPAASTDKEDKPAANGAPNDGDSPEEPKMETEEEKESETKPTDDTPMPDADSEKPEAPETEASKEETEGEKAAEEKTEE